MLYKLVVDRRIRTPIAKSQNFFRIENMKARLNVAEYNRDKNKSHERRRAMKEYIAFDVHKHYTFAEREKMPQSMGNKRGVRRQQK